MKYSQPMKVTKIIVVSLNISLLKLYGIIQLTITCYNTDAIGDSENTGGKTITGNPATVFVTLINLKRKKYGWNHQIRELYLKRVLKKWESQRSWVVVAIIGYIYLRETKSSVYSYRNMLNIKLSCLVFSLSKITLPN